MDDDETALSVLNKEINDLTGTLAYYDESGSMITDEEISLSGMGKTDISAGDIPPDAVSASMRPRPGTSPSPCFKDARCPPAASARARRAPPT